ncbi:recombinase family protein [Zobellia galactanivorans]|uniref:Large serine recombinase n=1 Tax=Zobellia galactanivorans (strain DSM 12802 / CCUG 47099 / CIP 106680 / NCIMB 13871 / Dsij) TaxID=63186 RepID=G0L481_ZOBGA|nr:recombinase family protein [Zobellia galactanivorans]CAZ98716.1 Large serine recombinase [Zobellia galactanivorans]
MLAIYCRISQEKLEGKDRSIKDQKLLGIELAESLKLPYKVYIDEGISGTKAIADRPAFSEMLDDIQDGKITSVYAYDQSRLERSPETRFVFKRLLKENNVKLYTDNGLVDTESEEGEMMGDFLSIINQYYARITARKIKSVLKRNAKEGKVHGNILPFGYSKDEKGYLTINEKEAEIVKEIYAKSLSGIGSSTIKNWLNETGVPTRYNKLSGTLTTVNKYTGKKTTKKKSDIKWSDKTVQDILRNPIYKGKRRWGKEFYDCPAILDADYWQKVNDNLPKNKHNSGKKVDHKYLLKGLLECAKCGRNLYGHRRVSLKDNAYICSSKRIKSQNCGSRGINIDYLEDVIFSRFLKGDKLLEMVRESTKNDLDNQRSLKLNKELETLEKRKQELERQKEKAIRLTLLDEVSESDLSNILKGMDQEHSDANIRISNIKSELEFLKKGLNSQNEIQNDISQMKDNTPFNIKRDMIHKYIKRIYITWWPEVFEHIIEVSFNLPIPNEKFLTNRGHKLKKLGLELNGKDWKSIEGIIYNNHQEH